MYLHNFETRYSSQFPWDWPSQMIAIEPPTSTPICQHDDVESIANVTRLMTIEAKAAVKAQHMCNYP